MAAPQHDPRRSTRLTGVSRPEYNEHSGESDTDVSSSTDEELRADDKDGETTDDEANRAGGKQKRKAGGTPGVTVEQSAKHQTAAKPKPKKKAKHASTVEEAGTSAGDGTKSQPEAKLKPKKKKAKHASTAEQAGTSAGDGTKSQPEDERPRDGLGRFITDRQPTAKELVAKAGCKYGKGMTHALDNLRDGAMALDSVDADVAYALYVATVPPKGNPDFLKCASSVQPFLYPARVRDVFRETLVQFDGQELSVEAVVLFLLQQLAMEEHHARDARAASRQDRGQAQAAGDEPAAAGAGPSAGSGGQD